MNFEQDLSKDGIIGNFTNDDLIDVNHLRLCVLGTGGGGNNTVNRLTTMGISGVDLVACNTDVQDLKKLGETVAKVPLGFDLTRGLGAGGFPDVGQKAADSSRHELKDTLNGTHLMFLTAGMGGGTGTGSAPVIAKIARDLGSIVVSIVTYPFSLERSRIDKAKAGIKELMKYSDTVIVVDNNMLVKYFPTLPINKAFMVADEIVSRAIKAITDTILHPSMINLDFADLKSVLSMGGLGVISVGEAEGPERIRQAVNNALSHPLMDVDYSGAKGGIVHITGDPNMTLGEANKIGELVTQKFDSNANVMWGARVEQGMNNKLQVISIATGIKSGIFGSGDDAVINVPDSIAKSMPRMGDSPSMTKPTRPFNPPSILRPPWAMDPGFGNGSGMHGVSNDMLKEI